MNRCLIGADPDGASLYPWEKRHVRENHHAAFLLDLPGGSEVNHCTITSDAPFFAVAGEKLYHASGVVVNQSDVTLIDPKMILVRRIEGFWGGIYESHSSV